MDRSEIKEKALAGEECAFTSGGRDYLLYGWNQCDGFVMNLECDGELIWQDTAPVRSDCARRACEFIFDNVKGGL